MDSRLGEHTLITVGEDGPGLQGWVRRLVLHGFGEIDRTVLFEQLEAILGPLPIRLSTPERLLEREPPESDELLVLLADDAAVEFLFALRRHRRHAPALLVVDPARDPGILERPDEVDLTVLGAVGLVPIKPTRFELALALATLRVAHRREVELLEVHAELTAVYHDLHHVRQEAEGLAVTAAEGEIDRVLDGDHHERILTTLERRLERARSWRLPVACFAIRLVDQARLHREEPAMAGHARVQVAYRLRSALRQTDHVWRWSDDELVLLSLDESPERLRSQARRLRQAVESDPIPGTDLPIRIAIGVARSDGNETSAQAFLERALDRLHQAEKRKASRIYVD